MTTRQQRPDLERLLATHDPAVIAADAGGRITHWNDAAERLYGWSAAEAVGRPLTELLLVPPQSNGSVWMGRVTSRRRDGSALELIILDAPLVGAGAASGIVRIAAPCEAGEHPDCESLTPREREIALMTVDGKTCAEIARELGISARTVESHRANAYAKLGVRTRAGLILLAARRGYLRVTDQPAP
jgi:PAS domain S-box-containing protein